jgi:hypothetical protein
LGATGFRAGQGAVPGAGRLVGWRASICLTA